MAKYRITESPPGVFKIYQKCWFFWKAVGFEYGIDYSDHRGYNSLALAKEQIERWEYEQHYYVDTP